MSKGILGIGCSFTWGESLYYYSDLENLPITEYHNFVDSEVNLSMRAYKDRHRYVRKLADYYDTWELVLSHNGGSNVNSFIDNVWKSILYKKVDISDFKLIVWQITGWDREITRYSKFHEYNEMVIEKKSTVDTIKYWDWVTDIQDYEITAQLHFIDRMCTEFEKNGIKVVTIVWGKDFYDNTLYQEKFKDRHAPIYFKDTSYDSFDFLLYDEDNNLTLRSEFKSQEIHKNDIHFGVNAQKLLSDSIIKKLENDNFKI